MMRRWLVAILFVIWTPLLVASSYIATAAAPASVALAAASPSPSASPTDPTAGATCDAGSMTWAICPIISGIADLVDGIMKDIIQPFLQVSPLTQTVAGGGTNPSYTIWQNFRNVASVMMILVFFAIIFGTAIGFDNYTIKKTLPHLIAGAILIPFSWYICAIMVDAGNILGQGMLTLMDSFIPKPQIDFSTSLSEIMGLVGGGLVLITLKNAGSEMGLALLITIVIAVLATMFTLVLRQILIIVLVVLSPFAFLAYILPNTQKLFDQWWKNLTRLILMYPLIMLIFEAGRIFAVTAGATFAVNGGGGAGGTTDYLKASAVPFLELAGLFLPLAAVPWTYKWAGGAMAAGAGAVGRLGGAANKRWGRGSDFDKKRSEKRAERGAASYVGKPISKLGQRMQERDADGNLKHKGLAALSTMGGSYRAGQGLGVRIKNVQADENGDVKGGVGIGGTRFSVKGGQQSATQKRQMEGTFSKALSAEKDVLAAERIRENEISSGSYKGFHDTIASEAGRAVADQASKARSAQAKVLEDRNVDMDTLKRMAVGERDVDHKGIKYSGQTNQEAAIQRLANLGEGNFLRQAVARGKENGGVSEDVLHRGVEDVPNFASKFRDIELTLSDPKVSLKNSYFTAPERQESAEQVAAVAARQKVLTKRGADQVAAFDKETRQQYMDRIYTIQRQADLGLETAPGKVATAEDVANHRAEVLGNLLQLIDQDKGGQLDPTTLKALRTGEYEHEYLDAAGVKQKATHNLGFTGDANTPGTQKYEIAKRFGSEATGYLLQPQRAEQNVNVVQWNAPQNPPPNPPNPNP
jgi:hypothetical protein